MEEEEGSRLSIFRRAWLEVATPETAAHLALANCGTLVRSLQRCGVVPCDACAVTLERDSGGEWRAVAAAARPQLAAPRLLGPFSFLSANKLQLELHLQDNEYCVLNKDSDLDKLDLDNLNLDKLDLDKLFPQGSVMCGNISPGVCQSLVYCCATCACLESFLIGAGGDT
eukprot:TRINITY_DN1768_c0_g1_i2.p2 TRINITY_DN1768_c0_g1~~TRINITY_DN1768_c0_g1_i2.p2  ORF type:complete len:181 (-),score=53.34 TRINITY_DN1768_c0_g1_i2:546-1055(-)